MYNKRDNRGRYTRSKAKLYFVLFLLMLGAGFYVFHTQFMKWADKNITPYVPVAPVAMASSTEPTADMTAEKVQAVQDKMLDTLSLGCEVKGVKEPDAAIILDTNGQMSIGRFMFQISTVQFYVKKFEHRDINRHDAIILALDPVESKELARKIIFEDNAVQKNWYNCSNWHDLQKQVDIIKEFMNN